MVSLLNIRAYTKLDDFEFEPVNQLVAWEEELSHDLIVEYIKDNYDLFDGYGYDDIPTARIEVWIRKGEDTHLIYPVSLTEDVYNPLFEFYLINQNKNETIYRD